MIKSLKSRSKARPRNSQGLCILDPKVCLQQFKVPTGKDEKKNVPQMTPFKDSLESASCVVLSQPPL